VRREHCPFNSRYTILASLSVLTRYVPFAVMSVFMAARLELIEYSKSKL